uniref:Shq1 C-terminal domain-containing protein n=1 Tax=Ditylum brightwellii TaxID=49249 RepID=A0A7S4R7Q1_9STRA
MSSLSTTTTSTYFTEKEHLTLHNILSSTLYTHPPSTYTCTLLLHLLDILYSYTYNHRLTTGEPTVESTRTVIYNSPTLSWLESYNSSSFTEQTDSIIDILKYGTRRMLIYPYIRSYTFITSILCHDVLTIFQNGKMCILKCLLELHSILDNNDVHGYLFNKIWTTHLICWIVNMNNNDDDDGKVLEEFTKELGVVVMNLNVEGGEGEVLDKDSIGLDLLALEEEVFGHEVDDKSAEEEEESSCCSEDSSDEDDTSSSSDSDDEEDSDEDDDAEQQKQHDLSEEEKTLSSMTLPPKQDGAILRSKDLLDDNIGGGFNNTNDNEGSEGMAQSLSSLLLGDDDDEDEQQEIAKQQKQMESTNDNRKKHVLIQEIG